MSATTTFRLELADGSAADPPTFETTVLNWKQGDSIFIRRGETRRVVSTRGGTDDDLPVLVVEPSK